MGRAPFSLVPALLLFLFPTPAWAGDAPHAGVPIETVVVRIDGVDHSFGARAYPAPLVLDLAQASGARDTPYHCLLSYHRALAQVTDWGAQIAPIVRLATGAPGAPPADEAQHNAAARQILSGDIVIHGEIHLDTYTIFITRYAKSIPRNLGIAIRRFEGPDHVVVQDLILHSPLAKALSAARWEVAKLTAKYPIAQ
jgi:hypothetical protein